MPRNPEIPVHITADGRQFRRGMAIAGQDAERFKTRVAANAAVIRGWATAAVLAGGAAVLFAKRVLAVADSIDKASRAANINAERLQTLRFAAEQSGIASEKMDTALARFNVTFGRVVSGMETKSSTVVQAFERLGLSVEELKNGGLTTEQTLDVVLGRLAGVTDGAEQAAIAAQLFGRSAGPDMRNLLAQGIDGLNDLENEAREAGGVIESALITRGVEIADKWASIMNSMARAAQSFALRAATALDNAFGFTESGRLELYRGDLQDLADERLEILQKVEQSEDRLKKEIAQNEEQEFVPFGGNTPIDILRNKLASERVELEAAEEEMNVVNARLLEIQQARQERENRLAQLGVYRDDELMNNLPSGSGGGGGGGGGVSSVASEYDRLSEQWKTRLELLQEAQAQELEVLRQARAEGLLVEEEYQTRLTDLQRQHAEARGQIARMEASARVNTMLGAGEDVLSALGAFNDRALRLAKVFGAAQALISTFQGAAEAMKLPFPANFAAAAAVTAKGLGLVAAIRGVSKGGGGSVPSAGGGSSIGAAAASPLNVYLPQIQPESSYKGSTISSLFDALQREAGDRGIRTFAPA